MEIGTVFGRWTVLEKSVPARHRRALCRCSCGTEKLVLEQTLKNGASVSCGCFNSELRTTHGLSASHEYNTWIKAKHRCTNKKDKSYSRYGGKGVTMWEGWLNDPQAFIDHIGPMPSKSHTLDRIDGTKGYEPGNVRWATQTEQANNKLNTFRFKYLGELRSVQELADLAKVSYGTMYYRLVKYKFTPEESVSMGRYTRPGVATLERQEPVKYKLYEGKI